jgi:hypothetical protein
MRTLPKLLILTFLITLALIQLNSNLTKQNQQLPPSIDKIITPSHSAHSTLVRVSSDGVTGVNGGVSVNGVDRVDRANGADEVIDTHTHDPNVEKTHPTGVADTIDTTDPADSTSSTSSPPTTRSLYPYQHITDVEASEAMSWILPPTLTGQSSNPSWVHPCDDAYGGDYQITPVWSNRLENRVVVCSGFTTITCLLASKDGKSKVGKDKNSPPSPQHDPVARMCFVENLVPPEGNGEGNGERNGERTPLTASKCLKPRPSPDRHIIEEPECSFTAYCDPVGPWKEQGFKNDAKMWRAYAKHNNPFTNGVIKVRPSELVPDSMKRKAPTSSTSSPTYELGKSNANHLHYFAFGDCKTWNPGHCNSDPINLALTQHILGFNHEDTSVYMARNLNYDQSIQEGSGDKTKPLYPLWEALSDRVYTRTETFENYPKYEDGPIPLSTWSMPAITSVWWGGNQCKARHVSKTYQIFRKVVDPHMDAIAAGIWNDPDNVRLLQKITKQSKNIPDNNADFFGPDFDNIILLANRASDDRRQFHNKAELYAAIASAFPNNPILEIEFTKDIEYVVQCSLWRRARVVVGIHGGNLGCAMFLSPGQGLVEGNFNCAPAQMGMMGAAAVHNGAAYWSACTSGDMDHGGDVNVQETIQGITHILRMEKDKRLSTWPDK